MAISMISRRFIGGITLAAIAALLVAAGPATAATINTFAAAWPVWAANPDLSPFEPGGALEKETPDYRLIITTTGFDGVDDEVVASASFNTAFDNNASAFKRAAIQFSNEGNLDWDIRLDFEVRVGGLVEYDEFDVTFQGPRVEGGASVDLVRNDAGAPFRLAVASIRSQLPVSPGQPSDTVFDAGSETLGPFRLEPGQVAIFVVDVAADATVVPLPSALGMSIVAMAGLTALAARRRVGRVPDAA